MSDIIAFKFRDRHASADARPAALPGRAARALAWAAEALRRRRSRRLIVDLDDRMLRDIGVSWAEAETEANKPWWRR